MSANRFFGKSTIAVYIVAIVIIIVVFLLFGGGSWVSDMMHGNGSMSISH